MMLLKKLEKMPDERCWSFMLARRNLSSSDVADLSDSRFENRAPELLLRGLVELAGDDGALSPPPLLPLLLLELLVRSDLGPVSSMALSAWKFAMLSEESAIVLFGGGEGEEGIYIGCVRGRSRCVARGALEMDKELSLDGWESPSPIFRGGGCVEGFFDWGERCA
jgi:hypothetical protein